MVSSDFSTFSFRLATRNDSSSITLLQLVSAFTGLIGHFSVLLGVVEGVVIERDIGVGMACSSFLTVTSLTLPLRDHPDDPRSNITVGVELALMELAVLVAVRRMDPGLDGKERF